MYQGIVTSVVVSKHPNADRLQLGQCYGHQVVLGLDTKDGEVGIFFPPDGRLSDKMLVENRLLKSQGGYFDDNGRVRAQKFRKVKSEGIFLPLSSVAWTGVDLSKLPVGTFIDTLEGELVCEKYYTPATLRAMKVGQKIRSVRRGETPWFRKHTDTPQLKFVIDTIPPGSLVYFTEKLHGTSGRFGSALEVTPNSWWRKLLRLPEKRQYRKLVGSKNVILTDKPEGGWYKDESFRNSVVDLPLWEGETIYYEIVGYVGPETPIMPSVDVKDVELQKLYGARVSYKYGCAVGDHKVYVYRITRTNEQGVATELSWPQVRGRCKELGLNTVPDMADPDPILVGENTSTQDVGLIADALLEGPSQLDHSHIREGICLRIEEPNGRIWFAKHKSFTFKVLEGMIKDNKDYVDMEEVA